MSYIDRHPKLRKAFPYIVGAILCIAILGFCSGAQAQECVPGDDAGPIATSHSAVKKPGDTVTLTWTDPAYTTDCTLLTGEDALTRIEVFIGLDAPVTEGLGPDAVVDPGVQRISLTVDSPTGVDLYYATKACNQWDCSALSNQPFVKVPGKPQRPQGLGAN